jgi:hypothetical protein
VDHEHRRDERLPEWRGWHAFRREPRYQLARSEDSRYATIQAILLHSNVAVTWKCYIKTRPDNLWRQSSSSKQQCALTVCKKLIN